MYVYNIEHIFTFLLINIVVVSAGFFDINLLNGESFKLGLM